MSKKLCKDTEIKAFSHWHFEFLMARFWAVPVFSNKVWADFPERPGRPQGQTYQHKSPLDDGEIFLYSRSWLVGQRNRCWIKGLGKNPQKEWARSLFAVPFAGVSQAWPAGLRENGMSVRISRIMPQNVYTRPPFYSWEKFCVYTRQPTRSG